MPANVVDRLVIIPQIRRVSNKFGFHIGVVIANSALVLDKVFFFIIQDLKTKPYIARKLIQGKDLSVFKRDNRICLTLKWCTRANIRRSKGQNQVCLFNYPFQ